MESLEKKLTRAIKYRVLEVLRNKGYKEKPLYSKVKALKLADLTGVSSLNELKKKLEKSLPSGFTLNHWINYKNYKNKKLELDHVYPISKMKLNTMKKVLEISNVENLQFLHWRDNRVKSATI